MKALMIRIRWPIGAVAPCLAIIVATLSSGCDINSYTPSADQLRHPTNRSSAFIVGERNMRGIYANRDVGSGVYAYHTNAATETVFWKTLNEQATDDDWALAETLDSYRRYVRIIPKQRKGRSHIVEEARVAYVPGSKQVLVAWVQAGVRELPDDFPDEGGAANFAKGAIWPRFEQELTASSGN